MERKLYKAYNRQVGAFPMTGVPMETEDNSLICTTSATSIKFGRAISAFEDIISKAQAIGNIPVGSPLIGSSYSRLVF